ncbi:PucR family transcriptional regulator [Mycolicibacterium phlei]|uniref:PucR family transcriptional regulator n=1 Tax=Mycolicibacterium phlei TaxID=1771 RepID=UPI0037CAE147
MTLDGLGSDPESVLAVVTYFDTLDDQGCGAADLVRAARLLGFDESRDVRVLAVSTDSPDAVAAVLGVLGGERVRTATMGTTVAVLHQGARDGRSLSDALEDAIGAAFPVPGSGRGPWVGIGSATPVLTAPQSWQQAQRALRFASSTGYGRRAIAFERLSVLDLLADLPVDAVLNNPDVARINAIAATPAGAVEVATVEAFCKYGSLRRTADELYVHHSTVATRLAHVSARMGWDFDDPMDRFIAILVFLVRRVALSATELGDG